MTVLLRQGVSFAVASQDLQEMHDGGDYGPVVSRRCWWDKSFSSSEAGTRTSLHVPFSSCRSEPTLTLLLLLSRVYLGVSYSPYIERGLPKAQHPAPRALAPSIQPP